ncbi:MAG: ATP-binding cassette domain-containing protein, partial [Candidatus Korarchaeota archaeon]|nr:ATP-binding cassette domain-containing protein [Candidatus Korarchaeota archaeon]
SLLVLDEPLTYLDSEASKRFVDALREAKKRGITIVVVEQDVEPLLGIIDKAIILDSGRATEMSGEEFAELYLEGRLSDLVPAPPRGSHECRPPPPRSRPAASVEDAWYRYPRSGEDALRGISLTIHEGAVNALIGPNGSGKTTMLKIIAGVLEPSRGVVRKRFKRAFYVPQNPLLALNGPTVEEEVKAAWREEAPYTPGEALKTMGLQGFEHRRIMHLSHGQRRRLAVASALASGTDMLLLDEPTAGLDAWSRRELPKHLRRIAEAGVTVVVATHDSALVAEAADHAVLLGGGVVREAGSPCTVLGGAGGQ